MTNSPELTHVCLDCGTKQVRPDNPFGWCCHCFGVELCLLSEIPARVFLNDKMTTKDMNFLLNHRAAGLFLVAEPGMGYGLVCTAEDIELLYKTLKQSLAKRGNRINQNNQNNQISLILSKGGTKDTSPYGRIIIQKPGYVYLGHSNTDDAYKIGMSITPGKRVKRLKCDLVHIIKTDNMGQAELKLHLAVADKVATDLVDTHGYEWFRLPAEYVRYIKTIVEYKNGKFIFKEESNGL